MIANLIVFSIGFIAVCISAFLNSIQVGLFVTGSGLVAIALLTDFDKL